MFGTTVTATVIAALAGLATYYSWDRNRLLSALLAVVTALSAAVAVIFAFVGALAIFLRILPTLLLLLGLWLVWKVITRDKRERVEPAGR